MYTLHILMTYNNKHYIIPVAADDDEVLASAMTVTLNDWDWLCPDNTRGTTSEPLDSDTDMVEELNSTVVTIWKLT